MRDTVVVVISIWPDVSENGDRAPTRAWQRLLGDGGASTAAASLANRSKSTRPTVSKPGYIRTGRIYRAMFAGVQRMFGLEPRASAHLRRRSRGRVGAG